MKSLFVFFLCLYVTANVSAQSAGPNSGGTFTTAPLAGSTVGWSNTGNTSASDDSYATMVGFTGITGVYTNYLVVTNFGFSIPIGVTITGIIVQIERADPNSRTADHFISIVKGGVISSTNKSTGASYPSSDNYQTFGYILGNSGELWGETWTPADINSSNFGIAIAAKKTGTDGSAAGKIDHVQITVYYNFITLPLKLIGFDGKPTSNAVNLNWVTTDESNMDYFEVQRSLNGRDFTSIGKVDCLNRTAKTDYNFADKNPVKGTALYRLKIFSVNGTNEFSHTITVPYQRNQQVKVYPTLWNRGSRLTVSNPDNELLTIQFFNTAGLLIGSCKTSTGEIPAQSLLNATGMIFYKVNNKTQLKGWGSLIISN